MGKQPRAWIVDFDSDALIDLEDVKSRGDRKAVFRWSIRSFGGSCEEERLRSGGRGIV
jgi:hypothetical protein